MAKKTKRIPIGKRIATLRVKKGWTQRRLMDELERMGYQYTRSYLAGVETGHLRASPKFVMACEKALDLEKDTLFMWSVLDFAERQARKFGVSTPKYLAMLECANLKPLEKILQVRDLGISPNDYLNFLGHFERGIERKYEREFGLGEKQGRGGEES